MTNSLSTVIGRAARKPSASISDWLGKSIKLSDGGFWGQFLGGQSSSGKTVTVDSAMQLSAVWSCVRIISTSVAGLPLGVYQREADGGRKDARGFELYDVIHTSPNEDMTAFQFWQAMVAAMLLRGNAYAEVHRMANRVVALDFLLPSRVDLELDDDGRITYWYKPRKGPRRQIERQNMLHIPAFSLDGRVGLSAIRYGADVFGAAMSADDAANGTFKNGLLPAVAFKVDRVLRPDQREEFRDYIKQVSGALNAGRSPVLEQGITPESIGINPVDAQLLESRTYSIEEICRWFGVPPWMVGKTDSGSNWGTGLEQQMIAFLTFSISSITNQIQQCVNKRLLTPVERRSYYVEFSLEAFLKADSAGRAEWYSKMTQNGIMTRDECRVKENLPRHGGNAAVLTVQTNLAPIDKLGQSTDAQTAQAALKSWLDQPQE
ncbi:phage portal protein [Pseudomonas sp. P5_152]|uniref:phage portal protein n=1 Tax=Pseudomonas sp. P5_152 TaxID=3043442 RepID=UPI002A365A33|nr:phage portal protein [Pseudomonas sp. P5_152]MDX9667992.1 phage portal protein [Pseudomonas sp. P5_152]